jgi:hypothetical protein
VPSAPLCAQPPAERRRHTECACYVDAFVLDKFIIARSTVSAGALPGKYPRRNQSRVARGRKAAPNVAGTLRVPSAPLCAQPPAKRRRHTECACYVGALFEIHRSPNCFCWNSSHALWHATRRRLGSRHLRRTTREKATDYRLQDEACPPPADVPCLPEACSLFRTTRRRRLVLVQWRC